jgi:hypothetical protein
MAFARRPAAYLLAGSAGAQPGGPWRAQLAQAARQRGWPAPEIYADDPGPGGGQDPAVDRLLAAIATGRHDALLLPMPLALGDPGPLMRLLDLCTQHGIPVSMVPPPAAAGPGTMSPQATRPPPAPADPRSTLARACLEALAEAYPDWRIWQDAHGWHARRRGEFLQAYRPGAPAFCVTGETAVDLAAQLHWQQAADTHAPDGCAASILPPPPWGHTIDAPARPA